MNEKPYTELTSSNSSKRNKAKETYVQDLYIDMLLLEMQWNTEKASLMTLIDKAIDERDEELFYKLSLEYKKLCKRFDN